MTTVSSTGIGSGLDVESIITKLMAIEQAPLTTLQTKASSIQSTVSEYGKVKSAISTLQTASAKLASASTWKQTTSTSSDPAVVATSSGSLAGTYSVEVQSLASVQSVASGVKAATDTFGAGTLHIELGAWGAGQTSFTPKSGATAVDVSVAATDTISDVRDKINAAGSGVTALIMTDAAGSRLILRSNDSGAAGAFRTSVVDGDGNNTDATGLSQLAFDPSAGVSQLQEKQTAADAQATVNGLAVVSPTNTFADIVDGLTLTMTAETTDPVTVTLAPDTTALKKAMSDFATAYSAVNTLIATDTKYNATTKTGGILQGDSAATGLQRQLRQLAAQTSGASSVMTRLSDVGFQVATDGTMTLDGTKADKALANIPELSKLFSNSSLTDPTMDGFGKRFKAVTDSLLGSDGALTTRTDGLGQQLTRNQNDQDALQLRLDATEKRLRAQYTALDTVMANLNGQSAYITQQIAAFNASK